jgi:endoglycosylceramidase
MNGIYVVLDMHQDAWGKFIATPPGTVCGPSTEPAIGWDGAPDWATLTDGGDTCRRGSREFSDAVSNAFRNFYEDTDGIQGQLVKAWAALAREFATETAVAGYDLINEPHFVEIGRREVAPQLGDFYSRAIDAIRHRERWRWLRAHRLRTVDQLSLPDTTPPLISADDNIVFAPHNYAESINSFFSIEQQFINIQRWASTSRRRSGWRIWLVQRPGETPSGLLWAAGDLREVGGRGGNGCRRGDPHALSGAKTSVPTRGGPAGCVSTI